MKATNRSFQPGRSVVAALLFICMLAGARPAHSASPPILIKVIDAKGVSVLGELVSDTDESVELNELKTGRKQIFKKSSLNDFRKGISEKESVDTVGLAPYLAWRIRRVLPSRSLSGKIASIDSPAVYVTLGSESGMEKGQELIVLRIEKEIKDPDTGKVLNTQKQRVARLEVTDALDKLSKARLLGDLDVELRVNDIVEPAAQSKPIAILPFVDLRGCVREGGRKLAEDLTSGLVQQGVSVVERTLLARVLVELGLQNTAAFDSDKAQKLGKQLGAYAVLHGTLSPAGNRSEANLRLVKVETGEILDASSPPGPNLGGTVSCGEGVVIIPSKPALPVVVTPDTCCLKAKREGKSCEHKCCIFAARFRMTCFKCNPHVPPPAVLKPNTCCTKAIVGGKVCDHKCCVRAEARQTVCSKCNP